MRKTKRFEGVSLGFENWTVTDVKIMLKERGVKQRDLIDLLGVDESSISIMLNPKRELTRYQKAMFFYLFEWLDKG